MKSTRRRHWERGDLPSWAYYDWIARYRVRWDWFVTLTFDYEASAEAALRAFLRWIRAVSRAVYGARQGRVRLVRHVAVAERHTLRDGYHVHAVVADVASLDRGHWRDRWYGVAKVDAFDPSRGGLRYVLKHAGLRESLVQVASEMKSAPVS